MSTRRAMLASGIIAAASLPLLGAMCTNGSVTQNVQTGAQVVQAIATGVEALVPVLTAGGLSPEATAQVQKWSSQIAAAAQQLATLPAGTSAATQVQQIETAVNGIIGVAASVTALPKTAQTVLQALTIALPIMETAYGVIAAVTSTTPATAVVPPVMTANQAIAVLNAAPINLR